MDNRYYKTISLTLFIFGLIFMAVGGTFAYFSASVSSNANDVSGRTYRFNVTMDITPIKNGNLIPLNDDLLDDTLNSSNVCTDTRGYGLCSLYKITLNNSGEAATMNGHLTTTSTTYTTNDLKYQLFTKSGNTYTAISDSKTVPIVANATSDFTLSSNNITFSLNNGTTTSYSTDYYLAIWLSDPGSNQVVDSNKTYAGSISFISSGGGSVSAKFSS